MRLLANERYEFLLKKLEKHRIVKVYEAALQLEVSEKTIREDLKYLEDQSLLVRVHGGARLLDQDHALLPIAERRLRHLDKKATIAEEAVKHIEENDTIIMDSGSTLLELARILPSFPMTVVTNDVLIMQQIILKPNIHLYVPGGNFSHGNSTLLGDDAEARLRQFRVSKAFMGTTCVHPEHGLSLITHTEVSYKKAIIQQAEKIYLLADQTKWNKIGLFTFASYAEVDVFITD
jgi:DeoR family fructose operon transcriptional repressor